MATEMYPSNMEITLKLASLENVGAIDKTKFQEIFEALITSGGLTGVKGGKTIIHFDQDGTFQKIQLDYYPWQRRNTQRTP